MCFCLHPHPNAPSVSHKDASGDEYAFDNSNLDTYNTIKCLDKVNGVVCL
jgi:hypothetical protein